MVRKPGDPNGPTALIGGKPIELMTQIEADGSVTVHCSECCPSVPGGQVFARDPATNAIVCDSNIGVVPADAHAVDGGVDGERPRPGRVARLVIRDHMKETHGMPNV